MTHALVFISKPVYKHSSPAALIIPWEQVQSVRLRAEWNCYEVFYSQGRSGEALSYHASLDDFYMTESAEDTSRTFNALCEKVQS